MYLALETYLRPDTVADCLAELRVPGTALIAGGTWLNVTGHERIKRVVDLQALPLNGIEAEAGGLRIGALTPLSDLVGTVPPAFSAIGVAAAAERNVAIRSRSTVGGRLARDRSDARLATAMLALAAQLEVTGSAGKSLVPLDSHLASVAASAVGGMGGIATAVVFPSNPASSSYLSSELTAVDAPTTDAALAVFADGRTRVATGGHARDATGTLFLPETSRLIATLAPTGSDTGANTGWAAEVRAAALAEIPEYSNALASGDYRRDLAATLIVRLVRTWLSGGEA